MKTELAENVVRLDGRLEVDLITAVTQYLGFIGVETTRDLLLAGLPVGSGGVSAAHLERALNRIGHAVTWEDSRQPHKGGFPFAIETGPGGFLIVVDATKDGYRVLDPEQPKILRHLPVDFSKKRGKTRIFRILPTVQLLQDRHSIGAHKGHWFWGRLFLKKIRLFDIVLATFFANVIAVAVSLFALQVYDRVIPGQSEATLWVLVAGAGVAISFEAALRIARARLIDRMGRDAEIHITQELFSRFIGMRLGARPASPGALVHMMREFGAVREFFTVASIGVVADLPFVFIFLLLIYGIAGPVVGIIMTGAVLTVIPSLLMQARMSRLARETMGGMSSASRLLTEAAYNLETVKTGRAEAHFQKAWEEIIALNAVKTTEQRSLSAFLTFWAAAMQQCTYVAAVVGGVYLVFAGEFSVGAIIAVSILSSRTLSPITQLSTVLSRWQNMKASLAGLEAIVASEQERDETRTYLQRPRLRGQIDLKNVRFTHPGSRKIDFQAPEFHVAAGVKLAILGGNGSGKSTFLRLVAGLFQAAQGEVLIDGMDIRQIDPTDVRRNIGYLSQEVKLFKGSLRDNLVAGALRVSDDDLYAALGFGGLSDFVRHHPKGLDADIADGGEGLSMGQKQSVGLARIFLQDPSIVLLDEPTAALDQNLEADVVARLGPWLKDRTCIVATHRMAILSQMQRVAIMKDGRILAEGERDAVLKRVVSTVGQPDKADA